MTLTRIDEMIERGDMLKKYILDEEKAFTKKWSAVKEGIQERREQRMNKLQEQRRLRYSQPEILKE